MRTTWAVLTVFLLGVAAAPCTAADDAPPPNVVANDNRTPAGTLRDGTLELRLEVRQGFWHPEDDAGPRLKVPVFAEAGKPPANPGPLLRVREGTEAHVTIHNLLEKAAAVHGLHTRPGDDKTPLEVPAGETRDVRFRVGAPGTYYYWASTSGAKDYGAREDISADSQLAGAIVVDPASGASPDRVFVVNLVAVPEDRFHPDLGTFVVNGKSWPYTERLSVRAGEHARWRWINVSTVNHPMHLHGAYFNVVALGDGEREETYNDASKLLVVTQYLMDGVTMTMDWAPERAGRWLFHCHLLPHFTADNQLPQITYPEGWGPEYRQPAGPASGHEHNGTMDMGAGGMAGLVMGITVLPGAAVPARMPASGPARKLELIARPQAHGLGNTTNVGYTLRENGRDLPPHGQMPGPPVVLTQNQPVEIAIVNRLGAPTSVHWHGIELDSYYDGVPGFGGAGPQVTPPVAPGSTFVAKFTPPRAGTFIYHTHWHDVLQLTKGLYGPLIIVPPGSKFDPETDKIVLISVDGPAQDKDAILVNGTSAPEPMRLRAGTSYRLRLINITSDNPGMTVSLLAGEAPVEWRAIAKDGADLPESQRKVAPAKQRVSVGETYDFEFVPRQAGDLRLDVFRPVDSRHVVTQIEVQ